MLQKAGSPRHGDLGPPGAELGRHPGQRVLAKLLGWRQMRFVETIGRNTTKNLYKFVGWCKPFDVDFLKHSDLLKVILEKTGKAPHGELCLDPCLVAVIDIQWHQKRKFKVGKGLEVCMSIINHLQSMFKLLTTIKFKWAFKLLTLGISVLSLWTSGQKTVVQLCFKQNCESYRVFPTSTAGPFWWPKRVVLCLESGGSSNPGWNCDEFLTQSPSQKRSFFLHFPIAVVCFPRWINMVVTFRHPSYGLENETYHVHKTTNQLKYWRWIVVKNGLIVGSTPPC